MRVLVVANRGDDDPGHLGASLRARGGKLTIAARDGEAALPPASDFDVVVSLGSDWSVYWPQARPHVEREAALLRDAVAAGLPTLGVCFGAQLLAEALGGAVERAPVAEIGWYPVDSTDPSLIPTGPYVQWHSDRFSPPPGARVLATSPAATQAYAVGSALGIQFHPEVTPDVVRRWCASAPADLAANGVDAEEFVAETVRRDDEAGPRADVLVATLLSGVLAKA